MTFGYSPVRIEKIQEANKILEMINAEEIKYIDYKVPSILKKIYNLFIEGREKIEDGLSIKELALILYPDLVTIDEMFKDKSFNQKTRSAINKTHKNLTRFRKWEGNKEIVLYPRKTPTGKWLYYNIQDDKEFQEVELRMARTFLAYEKKKQKIEQIVSMKRDELWRKEKEIQQYLLGKNGCHGQKGKRRTDEKKKEKNNN